MNESNHPLFLIDGIGLFFRGNRGAQINWTEIDFADLDAGGPIDGDRCRQIETDFCTFTCRAAAMGCTSVLLDGPVHLTRNSRYPAEMTQKPEQYRTLYSRLVAIAAEAGMEIFITTDLLFSNAVITRQTAHNSEKIRTFTADCCRRLFEDFPAIGGLIFYGSMKATA